MYTLKYTLNMACELDHVILVKQWPVKPSLSCVVLKLKKDDGKYVALDLGSIRKILDFSPSQ